MFISSLPFKARSLHFLTCFCSTNETAVRAYAAERLSDASGPSALTMAQALLPAFNVSASSIRSAEVTRVNVVATQVQTGGGLTLQAWLLNVSLTALLVRSVEHWSDINAPKMCTMFFA